MAFDSHDSEMNGMVILVVEEATLRLAEQFIETCEQCDPFGVRIPFDCILDRVMNADPALTEYILEKPALCPNCHCLVLEKTLVEVVSGMRSDIASEDPRQA